MSLYQYLIDVYDYTESEAEETILRWKYGLEIPLEVEQDIKSYYRDTNTSMV